jgi:hypothetical protein
MRPSAARALGTPLVRAESLPFAKDGDHARRRRAAAFGEDGHLSVPVVSTRGACVDAITTRAMGVAAVAAARLGEMSQQFVSAR